SLNDVLESSHEMLNNAEDALAGLQDNLDSLDHHFPLLPWAPEELEERAAAFRALARKHACAPARLAAVAAALRAELDAPPTPAPACRRRAAGRRRRRRRRGGFAAEVRAARRAAAAALAGRVNALLPGLGLEAAVFAVSVEAGGGGRDKVQFTLQQPPTMAPVPLAQGASSGEKSRLLLLLEACLPPPSDHSGASWPNQPVVSIMDEVDSHVGGKSAAAVGKLLFELSLSRQIISVTHSAPVAAWAGEGQHFIVEKKSVQGDDGWEIDVVVDCVTGFEREQEIARMAIGDASNHLASSLAQEMLA
ncbi:unnamed protein product, partial [Heterosigma akashiwo]